MAVAGAAPPVDDHSDNDGGEGGAADHHDEGEACAVGAGHLDPAHRVGALLVREVVGLSVRHLRLQPHAGVGGFGGGGSR